MTNKLSEYKAIAFLLALLAIIATALITSYAHAQSTSSAAATFSVAASAANTTSAKVYDANGSVLGYITNTATWESEFDMVDKKLGVLEEIQISSENTFTIISPSGNGAAPHYASANCSGPGFMSSIEDGSLNFVFENSLHRGPTLGTYFVVNHSFPAVSSFAYQSKDSGGCIAESGTIQHAYRMKDVSSIINSYQIDHIGI